MCSSRGPHDNEAHAIAGPQLFIGLLADQVSNERLGLFPDKRWYDMKIDAITDIGSARRAIELVVWEGEGGLRAGSEPEHVSHYLALTEIQDEFANARRTWRGFVPARPVLANPTILPGVSGTIHDTTARMLAEVFDRAYWALLIMLERFYVPGSEKEGLLLKRYAFMPMMTSVIRPLGEILTELPSGNGDQNAGPPFDAGAHLHRIPRAASARAILREIFDGIVSDLMELEARKVGLPRLATVRANIERIARDIHEKMGDV